MAPVTPVYALQVAVPVADCDATTAEDAVAVCDQLPGFLVPGSATGIPGYVGPVMTGGCGDLNELSSKEEDTVEECAAECTDRADCNSFEYEKPGGGTVCERSSTCTFEMTEQDPNSTWMIYFRAAGDDVHDFWRILLHPRLDCNTHPPLLRNLGSLMSQN
jgi:hypothetical protein